ncbi:hypothetical protein Lesp01_68190 [Lentzea sp. NBRC 102530]|nr:hypothetical protein Lesp01_68190 [Lentzea sp. NBRC 102530]
MRHGGLYAPERVAEDNPAHRQTVVDVTKFGNIPDGGGHHFVGRQRGDRNKRVTPGPKGSNYLPRNGTAFLHTVVDDHSRVAYAEIHTDERGDTATAVLRRAVIWFREHGVVVERVLSDNGSAYRSFARRDACSEFGIRHKRAKPYQPQTNCESGVALRPGTA